MKKILFIFILLLSISSFLIQTYSNKETQNSSPQEFSKNRVRDSLDANDLLLPLFESKLPWVTHNENYHNYMLVDKNKLLINPLAWEAREKGINLNTPPIDTTKSAPSLAVALQNPLEIEELCIGLKERNLTSIPDEIVELKNLKKIFIKNIIFKDFSKDIEKLSKLSKLTSIDIVACSITHIPSNISLLKSVEVLSFHHTKFSNLPEEFCDLENLLYLNIREAQALTKLPQNFGKLKKLEYLEIVRTRITSLPESIGECKNLLHINLISNNLNKLPSNFGNLENLSYLTLANNKLSNLPESFGQLRRLRIVDISNNQITDLPKNLSSMTNLITFWLVKNKLNKFPNSIIDLKKLSGLYITKNNINFIPYDLAKNTSIEQLKIEKENLPKDNIDSLKAYKPDLQVFTHTEELRKR
ncbi:leucine-rich repeat domain-containing protein [Hugenholtzia roseola]|uniref:leucine-rich repeat domain-containing protein n=1 Tax=Hugenholtzia roseola TaxID=1002 RepID=UPI000410175B|nr:leucine-rich repeat domain-containing protein [Hugenholtzia roseola]